MNGTLETILARGHLICGVQTFRGSEFASLILMPENKTHLSHWEEWSGFDLKFCQGLAAAMFVGQKSSIAFVDVENRSNAFALLADRSVDVVAGWLVG